MGSRTFVEIFVQIRIKSNLFVFKKIRIGGKFYERTLWKDVKFQSAENARVFWSLIRNKLIPDVLGKTTNITNNENSYRIFLSTDDKIVKFQIKKLISRREKLNLFFL